MAKADYWQRGESLDYVNNGETTIEANTIVEIGDRIGVAGTGIAPGMLGSLHVCGVFTMPKTGTAAVAMGKTVYWDGTGITDEADNGEDSPTPYIEVGYAAAAAAAADTTILVKLRG